MSILTLCDCLLIYPFPDIFALKRGCGHATGNIPTHTLVRKVAFCVRIIAFLTIIQPPTHSCTCTLVWRVASPQHPIKQFPCQKRCFWKIFQASWAHRHMSLKKPVVSSIFWLFSKYSWLPAWSMEASLLWQNETHCFISMRYFAKCVWFCCGVCLCIPIDTIKSFAFGVMAPAFDSRLADTKLLSNGANGVTSTDCQNYLPSNCRCEMIVFDSWS